MEAVLLRRRPLTPLPGATDAPSLKGVGPWFNVPDGRPPSLDALLGSVVLVEFWTYVCGNCTRTVPFLRDVYADFAREDVMILGVHTPELAVDRRPRNVAAATRQLGVEYPVGMDNDFAAWNRWGVEAWPTLFLLDRTGRIRLRHVGEGGTRAVRASIEQLVEASH